MSVKPFPIEKKNHFIFQKLDKLLTKGKNVLQLTAICSKYETEKEKVQPFKCQNQIKTISNEVACDNATLKDFKEVRLFSFCTDLPLKHLVRMISIY